MMNAVLTALLASVSGSRVMMSHAGETHDSSIESFLVLSLSPLLCSPHHPLSPPLIGSLVVEPFPFNIEPQPTPSTPSTVCYVCL
jgi:hypothetical protein